MSVTDSVFHDIILVGGGGAGLRAAMTTGMSGNLQNADHRHRHPLHAAGENP